MSDPDGKRVALLARPGIARDRLRGALAEAGAQLVLEADPLTLEPSVLDDARAQVVLVALDAQTEDALDRLGASLQDPAVDVIYEEAEIAAAREGWEAARWVRHLAAKLHRHRDVLPPGTEVEHPEAQSEKLGAVDVSSGDASVEPLQQPVDPAAPGSKASTLAMPHAFDPVLAEMAFDEMHGGDVPMADSLAGDAVPAFDFNLDFSYDGGFDPVAAEASTSFLHTSATESFADDTATGAFEIARNHAAPAQRTPVDYLGAAPRDAALDSDFDRLFGGDFSVDPSGADEAAVGSEIASSTPSERGNSGLVLELVNPDDSAGPVPLDSADNRFKHDLASLESRIAGMELVDDRIVKGPAQANGAVLVLAGIGGPDAVRQLLAALPVGFPRPVLVRQRLEGGRYDKLVAQMQRATSLRVMLAEPGVPAIAGVIYILPADVGIKVADAGIQFVGGGDNVLAQMPSADSAVLLLSGSDPVLVDAVMNHSWAGALVIGQSPDGCYDAAAPSALIARGADCGQPAELARRLADRWPL